MTGWEFRVNKTLFFFLDPFFWESFLSDRSMVPLGVLRLLLFHLLVLTSGLLSGLRVLGPDVLLLSTRVSMLGHKLGDALRAPASERIQNWVDFALIDCLQDRRKDLPCCIQLIIPHKVGVVSIQRVQNQGLVRLRDHGVIEPARVRQIQVRNDGLHAQTRLLVHHLDIHGLVWLDADHNLVSGQVGEQVATHVLELDPDLGLLLVEGFATLEHERHSGPTLVMDVKGRGSVGRGLAALGYSLVVEVAGHLAVF